MTIYFSTNIPEMRSLLAFNQMSNNVARSTERIATGQRINSGKDDPVGLGIREGLRADMKIIEAQSQALTQADSILSMSDKAIDQLLTVLRGDIDGETGGLAGLLASAEVEATGGNVTNQIEDMIKIYDSIIGGTQYNGQKLLDGSNTTGYSFLLGKDDADAALSLTFTISDLKSSTVGTTAQLADIAITSATDLADAQAAVLEVIATLSDERAKLGFKHSIVESAAYNYSQQLASTTTAEAAISNADVALESSRLARSELLSQNAMSAMQYSRSFAAFVATSAFK